MAITYIKPETIVVDVELQQMIATSPSPTLDPSVDTPTMDARSFDFFATVEEQEESTRVSVTNEEEWDDFEEEEI